MTKQNYATPAKFVRGIEKYFDIKIAKQLCFLETKSHQNYSIATTQGWSSLERHRLQLVLFFDLEFSRDEFNYKFLNY